MNNKTRIGLFVLLLISTPLTIRAQNYCVPHHQYSGTNPISNFALHTLWNINALPDPTGYILYPENRFAANLNIGESYPLTFSLQDPSGAIGPWHAWIDYNNDGNFDSSETIAVLSYGNAWGYKRINIPNNPAFLGKRRLRIMYGSNDPCDTSDFGYTQDYTVNITQNAPHPLTYGMPFESDGASLFIDVFKMNTLVNSQSGCDSICYSYYTDSQFTTRMDPGKSYTMYASTEDWSGIGGTYCLWIDLNNDGEFSSNERLYQGGSGYTAYSSIKIPANTPIGIHRLRIRIDWQGVSGPYGLGSYGETEDYDISIGHTSGVEDINVSDNQLMIYPNPVKNNLYIKPSGLAPAEIKSVMLYNEVGQSLNASLSSNQPIPSVSMTGYPPGFYLVNIVFQNGEISNYKVVKQ